MIMFAGPLRIVFLAVLAAFWCGSPARADSIAFYYNSPVPVNEAALYPGIVLQPDQTTPHEISRLAEKGIRVYAYLSVGEAQQLPSNVTGLAANPNWGTLVPDLTDPGWQSHVAHQAELYKSLGYGGLFLDTLDSFRLAGDSVYTEQREGLIRIIRTLSEKFDGHLILNRGFEVLEDTRSMATTVIAEGLYSRYSPVTDSYGETSAQDIEWLLGQMSRARQLGYQTQILDYAKSQEDREQLAAAILRTGNIPWVSDGHLTQWGTGTLIPVPRRLISLYRAEDEYEQGVARLAVHRRLQSYVEYLGYVINHFEDTHKLPAIDPALHAGIVVWAEDSDWYNADAVNLIQAAAGRIPVLLMGEPPPAEIMNLFGVTPRVRRPEPPYALAHIDQALRGEVEPLVKDHRAVQPVAPGTAPAEFLLALKAADDSLIPQVAVNDIGGLALSPAIIKVFPDKQHSWRIDPMYLLERALKLPEIPRIDLTTESGRRMLITHIDGDGMPNRSWFPHRKFVGEVIREEILERYGVPTTVSMIEGEIAPHGMFPDLSEELETIARRIFRRDDVEIASHSFSHPFYWPDSRGLMHISEEDTLYGYHLPVPGYRFDAEREILGSVDYINTRLAPPGKSVNVMLWTGEAVIAEPSARLVRQLGILNMNGGNTHTSPVTNSLSEIWPAGRYLSQGLYQVYAPVINENVYTNNWSPPYGGYRDVIKTFSLTDAPLRMKPLGIYYHFYSGEYPASLSALKAVYESALSQNPTALFGSDYIQRVQAFYSSAVGRDHDGRWHVRTGVAGTIATPRSWPEPVITDGVAGHAVHNNLRYIHTTGTRVTLDVSAGATSNAPFIKEANAVITDFGTAGDRTSFNVKGLLPIRMTLANMEGCRAELNHPGAKVLKRDAQSGEWQVSLPKGDHPVSVVCRGRT